MRDSRVAVPRAEDLANEPATLSVPGAGRYWGLGKDGSYRAHRTGTFPVPVVKVGGHLRVTRAALAAALGVAIPGESLAQQGNPQVSDAATDQ